MAVAPWIVSDALSRAVADSSHVQAKKGHPHLLQEASAVLL